MKSDFGPSASLVDDRDVVVGDAPLNAVVPLARRGDARVLVDLAGVSARHLAHVAALDGAHERAVLNVERRPDALAVLDHVVADVPLGKLAEVVGAYWHGRVVRRHRGAGKRGERVSVENFLVGTELADLGTVCAGVDEHARTSQRRRDTE